MTKHAFAATPAMQYRMPIESARHERTFMQWPSQPGTYGSKRGLEDVRSKIALIALSIARFEPVVVLARPEHIDAARATLGANISLWPIATDDLWCRDSGPTFVISETGAVAISDLNFNGWGNKQGHAADGVIAQRIAEKLALPIFKAGVTGEGGGIEVDGAGTAMAHESCWINRNRNSGSRADIESRLLAAVGAKHMIWAPGIKSADITDYHIDALARFVKPGQVVIQVGKSPDRSDPWSIAAFETYEILKAARDAQGRKLDIVVIPEPVKIRSRSRTFVASYVNYYVCNNAVIGAEFGDSTADAKAREILGQLYPGREIISLNVDPIGEAGGGIHCATQQQPVGSAA